MKILNYIKGKFNEPISSEWMDNFSPSTGKVIGSIPLSGDADVISAIAAAKGALPEWSSLDPSDRALWLDKIADCLEEKFEEIAHLESMDTGKPISLARSVDARRSVSNFRFFSEMIRDREEEVFEMEDATNIVKLRAVGVGALITPWNLPLYLLSWKVAPAIGMGNTVVCKPSELTPLTADLLMRVIDEVGLPPGVVNLVHGNGNAGSVLTGNPDVDLVSFTGGTSTGSKVAMSASPQFKKLSLELGGKNSSIVFSDCNLEETVKGVTRAAFLNQGQVCLCGSRILVEESIYDQFMDMFVESVESMVIGDPMDEDTDLGALISKQHLEKVESYVSLALEEGGQIVTGGKPCLPKELEGGNWMSPTVVTGLGTESRCSTEEVFGPFVTVHRFNSEEDAIKIANNTRYGLAGSIWTGDLERGRRVAESIHTGMIWVNTWLHRDLRVPFGGIKDSGVGREGGKWSLGFFSEPLNVCLKHD
ncbi:MAG TPA: aldehyde dehydrogenase [Candidatus Thalassarchaeaceae archaeon]|jgi:aminomuconate-semialdehyde/2-hydroxymuconate-6-semialdehyde dehydrogenase|nr:2-hydroxymuconic semialdehyde dehydrogenase [Euryarchaeota archaeon]DAC43739.1 MAG TPA: aldehyde dehydrogenase [Candidatus Poseidoniales archaeon]HII34940.1 aldehyde dehydrogenase [Candidatus Thalassarchaeaceae archaeon]|tara:strand:- start:14529 stop:15962 length:1434 start_codon:yes stop_codon:yes gene_type:complete